MDEIRAMGIVLAGGRGSRLGALTKTRAKPAVQFGGKYRIIDFPLSNLMNSGVDSTIVLTQYLPLSLHWHLRHGWDKRYGVGGRGFFDILPARQTPEKGNDWYTATADAIYKNLGVIKNEPVDYIIVLPGDHIYQGNFRNMVKELRDSEADVLLAVKEVPVDLAANTYGVVVANTRGEVLEFEEKPSTPTPVAGHEDLPLEKRLCNASMGIHIWNKDTLIEMIEEDAKDDRSGHDLSYDILQKMPLDIQVFPYSHNTIPGATAKESQVWWDVGNPVQYHEASMAVARTVPSFNLHNPRWRMYTYAPDLPSTKINRSDIDQVLLGMGNIITNSRLSNSIVHHDSGFERAHVVNSILFGRNKIAEASVRNAIIDKNVYLPPGTRVGYDRSEDEARGFEIYDVDGGYLTVVPKGYSF